MNASRADCHVLEATMPSARPSLFQRGVLWLTLSALIAQPITVSAQVISATSGQYKPQVGTAQNGVTVVQITAPSGAGVSRNQYQQFDVTPQGVVLNNSQIVVQTQQAGVIEGNTNLAGGAARVILNEVTSNLPSNLRGYTEVGGQKAEVIIANPNGITCDGCGFINTSRGVLTTGAPVFGAGGSLDAFRVTAGNITINGAGLNGSNTDQIDLIARAVQVNAELWGKALNVVTGANQVAYADLATQTIAGSGAAPAVSIDVAALGGMYAGKIRLVSTEAGVGVVSAGTIAAQAGDLAIDSAGRITLTGTTQASGRIDLTAQQDITHSGSLYALGATQLTSQAQIVNTGTLAAQGNLTLTAASINSSGTLAAGLASDGSIGSLGDLTLTATGSLVATGQQSAGNAIAFTGGSVNLANSRTRSNGRVSLTATAGDIDHRNGDLQAQGDVALNASGSINNSNGSLKTASTLSLSTGASYTHNADSTLRGDSGISLTSGGNLTLNANLDTQGLLQLAAAGTLTNSATLVGSFITLTAATLDNQGVIAAQNDLTANVSGRLTNRSNRLLYAGRDQRLYVNELLNEEDGSLYAGRDFLIQKDVFGTNVASVTNQIGTIEAVGDLTIRADTLTNQGSNPAVLTRSSSDAIPYTVSACPGGVGGCVDSGSTNAAGETIWNSAWGFRIATAGEVQAYFDRNPNAPTRDPGLSNYASSFLSLLTTYRADPHEREGGWQVWRSSSEQYLAPGTVIKAGRLLAGRDFAFAGGALNNLAGQIDANRDVSLTGATLVNQGQSLQTTTVYYSGGYVRGSPFTPLYTSTDIQTTGAVPSTIKAGGNLTGNLSASLTNDARARPATLPPSVPGSTAIGPLIRIPTSGASGLIALAPPTANYLIETNPLYADLGRFISSDYFLNRLGLNPQSVEKRLGDAAYEQNLVRDQIFALTGRRFLSNGASEMAQYQGLMDAAYAANEAFHFKIGIALTAEQVAQLTSDIVWLVERDIPADPARGIAAQKVLVPQVYLGRLTRDDLQPDGALIAANEIQLVTPSFTNAGRMIAGRGINVAALNITNKGTLQSTQSDSTTSLTALGNLTNEGGTIAGGQVNLTAGGNLINRADSFERTTALVGGSMTENVVGAAGRIVAGSDASLAAGGDLVFQGGSLTAGGNARLNAQGNLDLGTAVKTARIALVGGDGYRMSGSLSDNTGSSIDAQGSVQLAAGQNLNVTASSVTAGTSLTASAGGQLTVGTASDQEQFAVESGSHGDSNHYRSDRQTAKGSTLSAGTDLALTSGVDLNIVAGKVTANRDITLASVGNLNIVAGTSTQTIQSDHKGSVDSSNDYRYSERVQGSIVAAGRDLNVTAGSDPQAPAAALMAQGSALAAERDLKIQTTGDLQLLAAMSRTQISSQRTEQSSNKLETLNFELEQNRVLLSTLSAGNSLDLNVGGNVAAQIGTRDAQGKLQADKMTATGVVSGSDRQQVSVTRTGDGADAAPANSQVLGNLAARGIRNGAADSFSPAALQTGQAAVTALMQSGLLSVKNQPGVQAALNAPTPNGSALTYKDDSGKVTLTLAGQAKVQAVYSQLKLTETFDVKHFPDQGMAQIVTLVAAIALTVMTSGAGATLIGATAGTMSATMANAAFIAMASTMTGQLAGGASLGEAFEAGIKAGASSALSAGITYGMNDAMGMYAHDAQGNVVLENGAPKLSSSGIDYFKNTSALDKLGNSTFWTQTGVSATVQGALSSAQGGSFMNGLTGSVASSVGTTLNSAVGDWATQNGVASGDLSKVLLHSTIGAAQAKLTGQNALSGAIGGASAEVLSPLANQLDASTGNKLASELLTAGGALLANAALNPNAGVGGALTAANQALQTDRFNRQLHVQETVTLRAAAKTLAAKTAEERVLTAEQQKQVENYWFDQLRAEASAGVDPVASKTRQDFLGQVGATNQLGYMGLQGAGNYLADAQIAREVIAGLAGTPILGTDGKPIIADGGTLLAFQATNAQYNDTKLFFTNNANLLIQQFGSIEAAKAASTSDSRWANISGALGSSSRNSALLSAYQTPSEGVQAVAPEAYLAGTGTVVRSLVTAAVDAGKAVLGEAVVGRAALANSAVVDAEAGGWSQYDIYRKPNGSWNWPPNSGAISGTEVSYTFSKGEVVDRFGPTSGTFLAPQGIPYELRSLAPGTAAEPLKQYEVVKPFVVEKATVAPAFGETGYGVQYKIPEIAGRKITVQDLIDNGYLKSK